MAYDDDDDLFGEDFDFVDEDEEETAPQQADEQLEEAEQAPPAKAKAKSGSRGGKRTKKQRSEPDAEQDDKQGDGKAEGAAEEPEEPPGPPADHVVHVYEFGKFKRTINREFTGEDAAAFVVEYNRTSQAHGREAVAASRDEQPAPAV